MKPIAVIGMACRFPGAPDVGAFWRMLLDGVDAIGPIPPDRWDADAFYHPKRTKVGKMIAREGGFIEGVYDFDARFFGLKERQARATDPQQRLALELTWLALENAGLPAPELAGSRTGVYMGVSNYDYGRAMSKNLATISAFSGVGTVQCVAANHISYFLDVRGPSMAVDTACSASLATLHLAVRALHYGEIDLALAGGVNCILSPEVSIGFSRAGMLAKDGRCKTFDRDADGYGRSEGGGVVVLKRLADAIDDGDAIDAVVRGSALNHNGLSNGLSAPNGLAQTALIAEALADAGTAPHRVGYVEAHGTGTPLGDPIEYKSIQQSFAEGRETPCWIGSVKTNIGHLESGAGIAGFIKTALCVKHGLIPPHLHVKHANPYIPAGDPRFAIPHETVRWPEKLSPRLAGVSSFGFAGANAHMILAEPPPVPPPSGRAGPHLFTLSAKSETALARLAQRCRDLLTDDPALDLGDFCHSSRVGRAHFKHRFSATADTVESLAAVLAPDQVAAEARAVAGWKQPGVCFLFGDGAPDACLALARATPRFRELLELALSTLGLSNANPETAIAQNRAETVLAAQLAMAALWLDLGLQPTAVAGWGAGERAAATFAGRSPNHADWAALPRPNAAPPLFLASQGGWLDDERALPEDTTLGGNRGFPSEIVSDAPKSLLFLLALGADPDPPGPIQTGDATLLPAGRSMADFCQSMSRLYTTGVDFRWRTLDRGVAYRRVALPNYPFEKKRFTMTAETDED